MIDTLVMPSDYKHFNRRYFIDLAERVFSTFLQTFLMFLVASGWFTVEGVTDITILQKAALAGVAAVLSLLKGLIAKGFGSPATAALLPQQEDTPKPVIREQTDPALESFRISAKTAGVQANAAKKSKAAKKRPRA